MSQQHSMDAINIYMRNIARHDLLTAEEEITLSQAIAEGCEQSRERMIQANLRLVVKVARRYMYRSLPLDDLIEEGNIGLMRAVEKFDAAHGCRFSTYATWWIRQAVERAVLNQGRTIRVPVHVGKEYYSMLRSSHHLQTTLGREPTEDEIAIHMENMPSRVKMLLASTVKTESADEMLYDDGNFTLYDVTEDVSFEMPGVNFDAAIRRDMLQSWMAQLGAKEQKVVRLRFGLEADCEAWTLEAIGDHLGVTRERIRQIQVVALKKLRKLMDDEQVGFEEMML